MAASLAQLCALPHDPPTFLAGSRLPRRTSCFADTWVPGSARVMCLCRLASGWDREAGILKGIQRHWSAWREVSQGQSGALRPLFSSCSGQMVGAPSMPLLSMDPSTYVTISHLWLFTSTPYIEDARKNAGKPDPSPKPWVPGRTRPPGEQ